MIQHNGFEMRCSTTMRSQCWFRVHVLIVMVVTAVSAAGCARVTSIDDLRAVFGPQGDHWSHSPVLVDLNGDGAPERVELLRLRADPWPSTPDLSDLDDGVVVDGFAVFDGRRPNVPVFYHFRSDRLSLRLDGVDGQHLLVSQGGRDHGQYVWGWWRYEREWPPSGWEARERFWDEEARAYGRWRHTSLINVFMSK